PTSVSRCTRTTEPPCTPNEYKTATYTMSAPHGEQELSTTLGPPTTSPTPPWESSPLTSSAATTSTTRASTTTRWHAGLAHTPRPPPLVRSVTYRWPHTATAGTPRFPRSISTPCVTPSP